MKCSKKEQQVTKGIQFWVASAHISA